MNCTRCKSSNKIKRGILNQRQRYTCKDCGYNYTVEQKATAKPDAVKRQALQLYLEGLGFRSIGRLLNVSHVAVYHWIKSFGPKLENIRSDKSVEVVEIDELHTYVGAKKTTVGFGLLLIDMEKDLSTSLLAIDQLKQGHNYGES